MITPATSPKGQTCFSFGCPSLLRKLSLVTTILILRASYRDWPCCLLLRLSRCRLAFAPPPASAWSASATCLPSSLTAPHILCLGERQWCRLQARQRLCGLVKWAAVAESVTVFGRGPSSVNEFPGHPHFSLPSCRSLHILSNVFFHQATIPFCSLAAPAAPDIYVPLRSALTCNRRRVLALFAA